MMSSIDDRSGVFRKPGTFVNRAAGFVLLAYFSPLILLISVVMVLRSRQTPVFVGVEQPSDETPDRTSKVLWRFQCDDSDSFLNQFLTQTRLNLLPQLANVAHGDIPITTALR